MVTAPVRAALAASLLLAATPVAEAGSPPVAASSAGAVLAPKSSSRSAPASAAIAPEAIHYQGRFTDPGGLPLEGPVDLRFRLFPVAAGGTALWSEDHTGVSLNDGVASVLLGSIVAFPPTAFSSPVRFLEITVDGEALAPRLSVASVPFAFEADRLDGLDATDFEAVGTSDTLRSALRSSDGNPPNTGEPLVHWDRLTGVPEGFADGVDDANTGVTDHGALDGLEDDDHPQYLLRSDAAGDDGSPPNAGSNLVHWDNLVGVPPGFADGVDAAFSDSLPLLTGAEIADSSLSAADIQPGSLTGDRLAPGTITGAAVALETLTGDNILDDGIRSADILDGTVTGTDLRDGTVSGDDLAPDAVTGDKIADGTIQLSDVGFLAGDITSVTPGPGLSGGGESGDVSLAVGAGSGISVIGSTVSLTPSYTSGSAYDGRFVARSLPTWSPAPGVVSVAGAAFQPVTPAGKYTINARDGYLYVDADAGSGAEDEFTAAIQLPHGGQITQFWVTYWDANTASFEVSLRRARQDGTSRTKVATVVTAGASATWESGSDAAITETAIDNIEYVYWLEADFPNTPQGLDLRLLSVRVQYIVSAPY